MEILRLDSLHPHSLILYMEINRSYSYCNPLLIKIVFWSSLISLGFFAGLAVFLYLQSPGSTAWLNDNTMLTVALNYWMVSATILWFFGFYKIAKFWNHRNTLVNVAFLMILFALGWFAAYYFYVRKEEIVSKANE